jgi:glutathione S-transferase
VQLFMVGASPYARKVLALAVERGLRERIEVVIQNPHQRPPELVAANPLSKVPTLIADDDTVHIDSFAICSFLDTIGSKPPLIPLSGAERWPVLQRHALANGILDCSVSRRVDSLMPPEKDRAAVMEKQRQTTIRALDRFESKIREFENTVAIDTITLACGLSYLDFRFPDDNWREGRPRLAAWHATFEQRPSMERTRFFT